MATDFGRRPRRWGSTFARTYRRWSGRLPAGLTALLVALARRRRLQLVATLVVGLLLGVAATGLLGGHGTGGPGGPGVEEAVGHMMRGRHG